MTVSEKRWAIDFTNRTFTLEPDEGHPNLRVALDPAERTSAGLTTRREEGERVSLMTDHR